MNYYISVLELDIFPKTIYNFLFFKTNVVLKLKYCFKVEILFKFVIMMNETFIYFDVHNII